MIKLENKNYCLTVSDKAVAESLIFKKTGEELLDKSETLPLFALTEERPYNNEIKLAYPNKETTFNAVKLTLDNNRLTVAFELICIEAVIDVKITDSYIAFELIEFKVPESEKENRAMAIPPVYEFTLLQLPLLHREHFGQWLNVLWDDEVAVGILAKSPAEKIDSEERRSHRLLYAKAKRDIKLIGATAFLMVSSKDTLLDDIAVMEEDYNLPKGAKSRMSENINRSIFWVETVNPSNVDEHIHYCKKMGFKFMLLYYRSIFYGEDCYKFIGDYDYLDTYPNGLEDLRAMLTKIKNAGITPGIHFLHSHIGIHSRYTTPIPDHRLNLRKHFTLNKEIGLEDDIIYVEENPEGSFIDPDRRVLRFDDEFIYYESYTTERPYSFKGCKRGYFDTIPTSHRNHTIGGLLDLSEYGAWSIHINQNTSLQDEIADKLSEIYNAGFEFIYLDGSEGTNAPYEYHVPNAQLKVYSKLKKEPLFAEAAAKAHFSWHMISGGNAFDVFPAEIFKAMIKKYPLDEAPKAAEDFTRVNFGWWRYALDTEIDMYEYATSKAAAWDCPVTVCADMPTCRNHPRSDDIFEMLKRWEKVREEKLLTTEQKLALRDPDTEYTLFFNEDGEFEILPYYRIENVAGGNNSVSAYYFERNNENYIVIWDNKGEGEIILDLDEPTVIKVGARRYIKTKCSKDKMILALQKSRYKNDGNNA